MATSQQFISENGHCEEQQDVEPAEEPVEDLPFDRLYLTDRKIKYINKKYTRINAKMYDSTCDVKLKVGNSFFKGHRKVLSDASDYFDAMFKHEMKEKDEFIIEIKDLSPAGISAMLDYFYHGHVSIEEKIVPNILEAGRFFHVDWILDICCDYMIRHMGMLDYPLTMELSDRYSLGDLRWDIFRYFSQNLVTLVEKETFYKDLCFDFLFSYLMESLYVDVNEFTIMQLVLKWVEEDNENRKEHLLPLLRQIRFPIMDLEDLEEIPSTVTDIKELREEVEDAKMYCLNIPCQCMRDEEKHLSRGARPTVMLSTFFEDCNFVIYKDPYDDNANLFEEKLGPSGLFTDYSTMNTVVKGNFLFAVGGYDFDCVSSNCTFRYDPRDRCWTQLADMGQARVSFSLCSSKDGLYAVGGKYHLLDSTGEDIILASVEMYDPNENSWKMLPQLPTGCYDTTSAYCRDKLYVTGGISEDPTLPFPLKSTLALTKGKKEWSTLPEMLCARQGHSMSTVGDKLYVLGGYTSSEEGTGFRDCYTSEVLDVETQQWTEIASSPEVYGHIYRHVGLCDTRIYFLSTEDSEVYLGYYDTENDEYSEPLNVGPGVCKVCVLSIGYPYQ